MTYLLIVDKKSFSAYTIHPPNPGAGLVSYLMFVLQTPEPVYRTD